MTAPGTIVVTIDGPAGAGKSTLARRLAQALGWAYLDTGAMYRLVTLAAADRGVSTKDEAGLAEVARTLDASFSTDGHVHLDGVDVTRRLRSADVTAAVALVAAWPEVRRHVVVWQRAFAEQEGRVVAEGRDTGSVVFVDAVLKVYLDADPVERARRRLAEETGTVTPEALDSMRRRIEERDARDRGRAVAPLIQAPDAWRLDGTSMTPDEVLAAVLSHVRSGVPVAQDDESRA